ncbi:MAG: CehA/McbA family metallohydrolase [Planctomycetes bacterium]|nr:CehA/McbA family metallohydrolase [Planctomycetota bacterium]
MSRRWIAVVVFAVSYVIVGAPRGLSAQPVDPQQLAAHRQAALKGGDAARGKRVFESQTAGCQKCHPFAGEARKAGPELTYIGDKLSRDQLIQAVLEPSATVHPDFGTVVVTTHDGKVHAGVLIQRTAESLQFYDAEGKPQQIPLAQIEQEKRVAESLMPAGIHKQVPPDQFADLIAYLGSLKQSDRDTPYPGLPSEIPALAQPIRLVPLHSEKNRFDFPVWVIALPGHPQSHLVVEQKTRQIWRIDADGTDVRKELFADFSAEATTGEFEGVVCLAFHPEFQKNRKYYVNYHVRNQGSFFSPVIVERQATADLRKDAGLPSRRLLQIHQNTDIHWGGMLAFGPDGYLYIGAGDAGPQEDPEGHSQDMSQLAGKILRIDVDHQTDDLPYAIPETNPYRHALPPTRREIWASGVRMPWRFSFDPLTSDLWIGDVGQNLFDKVLICRAGENQGWNVYEGFHRFSDRYRRAGERYVPPIFAYRRRDGVSVTGGYVYRAKRESSFYGAYIFGDFESKRIWALTQADRQLLKVRQIGQSPQRIASFGLDHDGELLLVGYEGTVYRLHLDGTEFPVDPPTTAQIRILRNGVPAAARLSLVGPDRQPLAPAGAAVRKTSRGESYFYADGSCEVKLPPGNAHLSVSGGLETIPRKVTVNSRGTESAQITVHLQPWIDMAARGWYSGDSHVHLHTGGPIEVTTADALVAARAEGLNFTNLCVSNNVGDDLRDVNLITGQPAPVTTDRHIVVFGEEMRSMIYGHMQFFGIRKLVEPQYTGFDNTPNHLDFPANHSMAAEAVRQGGVVTYGHPLFTGQPFPFEDDLKKPNGAARELPIDAILGVVQAMDLMSYNSDEEQSAGLWYKLLNCGIRLSACVGTDALLDRSTDPLGGSRVYVKTTGPLTLSNWLEGLRNGRTLVTNGPIPGLTVQGQGSGETIALPAPGTVRASISVESLVPFRHIELLVSGKVVAHDEVPDDESTGPYHRQFEVEVPIERSSWIALRVRGPDHPTLFDGPAWAHTSPIYVTVAGKRLTSRVDAEFFCDWIDQLLRVVVARNRYASAADRQQVEAIFRQARAEFRKQVTDD